MTSELPHAAGNCCARLASKALAPSEPIFKLSAAKCYREAFCQKNNSGLASFLSSAFRSPSFVDV